MAKNTKKAEKKKAEKKQVKFPESLMVHIEDFDGDVFFAGSTREDALANAVNLQDGEKIAVYQLVCVQAVKKTCTIE
jgi:hypothetical protein